MSTAVNEVSPNWVQLLKVPVSKPGLATRFARAVRAALATTAIMRRIFLFIIYPLVFALISDLGPFYFVLREIVKPFLIFFTFFSLATV